MPPAWKREPVIEAEVAISPEEVSGWSEELGREITVDEAEQIAAYAESIAEGVEQALEAVRAPGADFDYGIGAIVRAMGLKEEAVRRVTDEHLDHRGWHSPDAKLAMILIFRMAAFKPKPGAVRVYQTTS